jgi:hypothetical protein
MVENTTNFLPAIIANARCTARRARAPDDGPHGAPDREIA